MLNVYADVKMETHKKPLTIRCSKIKYRLYSQHVDRVVQFPIFRNYANYFSTRLMKMNGVVFHTCEENRHRVDFKKAVIQREEKRYNLDKLVDYYEKPALAQLVQRSSNDTRWMYDCVNAHKSWLRVMKMMPPAHLINNEEMINIIV